MKDPKVKQISFANYQKYFLHLFTVNNPDNKAGTIDTPIFYRIEAGSLIITFSFSPFIVEVKESMEVLKAQYDKVFKDFEGEKPEFIGWIIDKFMDKRGIPEL